MSVMRFIAHVAAFICLHSELEDRVGASEPDSSSIPTVESAKGLQEWLPGTEWKQVDANFRLVFAEDFVRRPRAKNKMPWKVIGIRTVEVTAAKGKRRDTYQFHKTHLWFTNDHKGQVFHLEKQKDVPSNQAAKRSQSIPATQPSPEENRAKGSVVKETKPSTNIPAKVDAVPPPSLAYKIAGAVLALPLIVGLLALLGRLIRGSADASVNSLQGDAAPTGNTLEDHSRNTPRLIGGLVLYAAAFAGLTALVLQPGKNFTAGLGVPFLGMMLALGLNLMFLRFHLVLSRNPRGLTKYWCVLSVPCELRSIRGDQLQRIEITRKSRSSGSDSSSGRVAYFYPVELKHELGTVELDSFRDFESARKQGERIANFMSLDLHASPDRDTTFRKSGSSGQSLRERVKAGKEIIETLPRPEDCRIKRNLDGADVVFELPRVAGRPREKILVSAATLQVAHGGESFVIAAGEIADLEVKDSHQTFDMLKVESGVDPASKSVVGDFALKFADRQYAKQRFEVGSNSAALFVLGEGVDHEFGYELTPEEAHWLRASLCQILTS